MPIHPRWSRSLALAALLCLGALAAAAQTATAPAPAGAQFNGLLSAVLGLALPAVGLVAIAWIRSHVKNQQMAAMLTNAVQNAVGMAQKSATTALANRVIAVTTGNAALDSGVQYVVDHAAEAVAHFGVSPDKIAEKIEAKMGLAEIAAGTPAVAVAPAPMAKAA